MGKQRDAVNAFNERPGQCRRQLRNSSDLAGIEIWRQCGGESGLYVRHGDSLKAVCSTSPASG